MSRSLDNLSPFGGSDIRTGTGVSLGSAPVRTRWTMYLKRGGKTLPISGHRVELLLTSITLKVRGRSVKSDTTGGEQERSSDWEIEAPESNSSPQERTSWKTVSAIIHPSPMKETAPGVYEGTFTVARPWEIRKARPVVEGKQIERVVDFVDGIQDWSIYQDDPVDWKS